MDLQRSPRVVVVGSGVAGLVSARQLARAGCSVDLLTAARAGRDSASARVHALAPWVMLTAPSVRGDSPEHFFNDLKRRGKGLERPGLAEVFAEESHSARADLCSTLNLERLDNQPLHLPGDHYPRGWRCIPSNPHDLLGQPLGECIADGVRITEFMLTVGLLLAEGRISGVVLSDRKKGGLIRLSADAVVLACGGTGRVFSLSTSPRWNRGTALALARRSGVLLHHPGLVQLIPVESEPPHHFPGTTALLRLPVVVDGKRLGSLANLADLTKAMARAQDQGRCIQLGLDRSLLEDLPLEVRTRYASRQGNEIPITLAVHHGIGGVAIDAWGRSSLPGLFACGEAAGGVQGEERTMGTGLLEAFIFAKRTARAIIHDWPQLGPAGDPRRETIVPPLAAGAGVHHQLDTLLQPYRLHCDRTSLKEDLARLAPEPLDRGTEPEDDDWSSAIRYEAAIAMLGMQ